MSQKQPIVLIGGGGHCKSVIDIIEKGSDFQIIGVLDKKEKVGQNVFNHKIIASDEDIPQMVQKTPYFLITVGQIQNSTIRANLYNRVKQAGGELVKLKSPLAHVSDYASIGEGTVVMHQAMVNAGATVGCNTIINSKALVEHDAKISDHCHIATGALINGDCRIGSHTFIGSGAVVVQGVSIGEHVVVGAGAVVTRHLTEPGTYAGIPARLVDK